MVSTIFNVHNIMVERTKFELNIIWRPYLGSLESLEQVHVLGIMTCLAKVCTLGVLFSIRPRSSIVIPLAASLSRQFQVKVFVY